MNKCCGDCFGDRFLPSVIERESETIGNCPFCGSSGVKLIDPPRLLDYFDSVFAIYQESSEINANGLEELFRTDWGLFDRLDSVKAEALLVSISGQGELPRKKFISTLDGSSSVLQKWEEFRNELKHKNRFFLKNRDIFDELKRLFELLEASAPAKVFRARACEHNELFDPKDMGKPPQTKAGNGRANPVGIPCLYVASDSDTAIAEIRPHKGQFVCVAEFEVMAGDESRLHLIDLRNPRKTVSPFELEDETLRLFGKFMEYLCRLGEELTEPILPQSAHLEYLPSQYLCEYIKSLDYDGVIYRSAMGPGVNYAVFNDEKLAFRDVSLYKVDDITLRSTPVPM